MTWPEAKAARTGPLSNVRVLDLSAFAVGPWSAGCLATLGADVIKVDPPYGDPIRRVRPHHRGEPTTYTVCNLGKRLVRFDLKDPNDRELAFELAREVDVVIENHRTGAMDRLGFGYEDLRALNPGIVYCSSGSYGHKGPMSGVGSTDPHGQAFSGFVSISGPDGGPPEFLRYSALVDLTTSSYLLGAALLGLHIREETGMGCHIVTSQLEAALGLQWTRFVEFLATGAVPEPMGSATGGVVPSQAFRCRDGRYVNVSVLREASWHALCTVLGQQALETDERYRTNALRVANRATLVPLLAESFQGRDLLWWRRQLTAAGVPNGEYFVLDDAVAYPEAHPLGQFLERIAHPAGGTLLTVRPPWRFGRTPTTLKPAELPGQSTETVASELGAAGARDEREATGPPESRSGSGGRPPLAGLAVLELTQGLAGPYCGHLLAALGADVLKLEPPEGDVQRELGPTGPDGAGATYLELNRQKSLVRFDWKSEAGSARLAAACARADVILLDEGDWGAGSMVGLPEDLLEQSHGSQVVCALSPLGTEGALAGLPATELEIQGMSGLSRYLGRIGESPLRVGADVGGLVAGLMALCGILAALHERRSSGLGQRVGVSALGSLLALNSVMVAALDDPDDWEGFHCLAAGYPPINGIPTKSGLVSLSTPRTHDGWVEFCERLGAKELGENPRYSTDEERLFRSRELNRDLEPYSVRVTREELIGLATSLGGIGVPLQDYPDLLAHPQVKAMEIVQEVGKGFASRGLAIPWTILGPPAGGTAASAPARWADLTRQWDEHGVLAPEPGVG